MMKIFLCLFLVSMVHSLAFSQAKDTLIVKDSSGRKTRLVFDSSAAKKFSPRKAAILSAILPGAGQVYNRKYWKVPIVYAAIGIPVYLFFDNKKWYEKTRDAAKMLANADTANYRSRVDPKLYIFFSEGGTNALNSLLNYRNEFRKNMDYSIVFTLLFWGLNVIDATVDAHLKGFNISDDLSLKVRPTLLSGNSIAGVSLVLSIGKNHSKTLPSLR